MHFIGGKTVYFQEKQAITKYFKKLLEIHLKIMVY